jgi:diguanylate cyclase (GGDEF)-like protein
MPRRSQKSTAHAWRKVMWACATACFVVAALTAAVIRLQMIGIHHGAQTEARNLARSVAYGASFQRPELLQAFVKGLDKLYSRDIVIVDRQKLGVADSDESELHTPFTGDPQNEVGLTLLDGRERTFVEDDDNHPEAINQVTVPLHGVGNASSQIVGAVILESSAVEEDLRRALAWQIYAEVGVGALCILVLAYFGVRLANSMQRQTDEIEAGRAELQIERERERLAAEQVEHMAYHDKLTELPNRAMLFKVLATDIDRCKADRASLAVLFVDLDRFKNINDTLGHHVGDRLLKEMSLRLQASVRASDMVARLGGDEFVVLLRGLSETDSLKHVAQKILNAVSQPLSLEGQEFHVTASIGISVYPADGEDELTLMKRADIAMYLAKDEGKNAFAFYSPDQDRHSVAKLAFESSLRRALEEKQFVVHYQPQFDCQSGSVTGVEALVRWQHPDLGLVPPGKFIPVAEETGLIVALGQWVLRTACAQHVAWRDSGLGPVRMSVNLSARQFSDEHLLELVRTILDETGMDPTMLELEVTESVLMRDVPRAKRLLVALNDLGIRLSVDDFGTGYSSLSNLKRFPVDTIKIDRSFIRDLPTNGDDKAIADAIISMGKMMQLTVIAEGVETQEQADFLRTHGCDEFQGFLAGKAVPPLQLTELLARCMPEGGHAQATRKTRVNRWTDVVDTTY